MVKALVWGLWRPLQLLGPGKVQGFPGQELEHPGWQGWDAEKAPVPTSIPGVLCSIETTQDGFHSDHLNINHKVGMLGSEVFATTENKCKVSEIADSRDSPRWILFNKCQKNVAKRMESGYLCG